MTREIARAGGVAVSDEDLLLAVRLGPGSDLLQQLLFRRLAAARAAQEGLAVEDAALDEALAQFFADNDAFEAPQVEGWLRARKLSKEDVRGWVKESMQLDALREHLVPEEAVTKRFKASPHDYAKVSLEVVEFEAAGAASETALQLREGETTWERAAAAAGGMSAEELTRKEAPEEAAALLFSAGPGTFVGPIETDEGGNAIYRVLSRREPELTEELAAEIREAMFRDDLLRPLARAPLTLL